MAQQGIIVLWLVRDANAMDSRGRPVCNRFPAGPHFAVYSPRPTRLNAPLISAVLTWMRKERDFVL